MISHKFTVIIPTRERSYTLKETIKSCLSQDYQNLQIIVSDNFSQDDTKNVVLSFNDERIMYVNTGRRVGMVENFEFAFSHVTEGYVISIGDDDGLALDAIKTANEILNTFPNKALVSEVATYHWPDHKIKGYDRLVFSSAKGVEVRKSKDYIYKTFYEDHEYNKLPGLYYSFIPMEIVNKIRDRFGKIFLTNQVDVFSAVMLTQVLDSFVFSRSPLVLAGISSRSNGASFFSSIEKTEKEKSLWEKETLMHPTPPFKTIASIKVLLAEAYQKIADLAPDLLKHKIEIEQVLSSALYESKYLYKNYQVVSEDIKAIGKFYKLDISLNSRNTAAIKTKRTISKFKPSFSLVKIPWDCEYPSSVFEAAKFMFVYNQHEIIKGDIVSKVSRKLAL